MNWEGLWKIGQDVEAALAFVGLFALVALFWSWLAGRKDNRP